MATAKSGGRKLTVKAKRKALAPGPIRFGPSCSSTGKKMKKKSARKSG